MLYYRANYSDEYNLIAGMPFKFRVNHRLFRIIYSGSFFIIFFIYTIIQYFAVRYMGYEYNVYGKILNSLGFVLIFYSFLKYRELSQGGHISFINKWEKDIEYELLQLPAREVAVKIFYPEYDFEMFGTIEKPLLYTDRGILLTNDIFIGNEILKAVKDSTQMKLKLKYIRKQEGANNTSGYGFWIVEELLIIKED